MKTIVLFLFLCTVFYLLYSNGYLCINAKRALLYVGSLRGDKARFISCTGHTERMIRFRESGIYHFSFAADLSAGEVSVGLFDKEKHQIMHLDSQNGHAAVTLNTPGRYRLVVRFKAATGSYKLERS